jgi:hypothetical protein
MKNQKKTQTMSASPRSIRTYLTVNLALAVLMAIVMAVRSELRSGRFLLIDLFLFAFYCLVLSSIFVGPFAIIEIYLYRRKKGAWYAWMNQGKNPRRDREINLEERRYWKSEAFRARLGRGSQAQDEHGDRTRLFETGNSADAVSRAALLMNVADKFERSGKREAAERCYLQITQRFADSPQAQEAAQRLSGATKVDTSRGRD